MSQNVQEDIHTVLGLARQNHQWCICWLEGHASQILGGVGNGIPGKLSRRGQQVKGLTLAVGMPVQPLEKLFGNMKPPKPPPSHGRLL